MVDTCRFNKFGHCKFKATCRKVHLENVCQIDACDGTSCNMRHPVLCRYFSLFGRCKFSPCSYRHEVLENKKIRDLEAKVEREEINLKKLELSIETKTKLLKDLEIKVVNIESKTSLICEEISNLHQRLNSKEIAPIPVPTMQLHPSSSNNNSQSETPPHSQIDKTGYPECWKQDFKPTCCNHIHDPGRGGRNVPPDLSQCCNHRCRP